MAFRASNEIAADAYSRAKVIANNVRVRSVISRLAMAAGDVDFNQVFDLRKALFAASAQLTSLRSTPGILVYAQEQEVDPTYDVVVEFDALVAAIDATIEDIAMALPVDGAGFLLVYQIGSGAALDPRLFTSAQTATLRTSLSAIEAAVA